MDYHSTVVCEKVRDAISQAIAAAAQAERELTAEHEWLEARRDELNTPCIIDEDDDLVVAQALTKRDREAAITPELIRHINGLIERANETILDLTNWRDGWAAPEGMVCFLDFRSETENR